MPIRPKSEYELRDRYTSQGWVCLLTPGSRSPVDLIVLRHQKNYSSLLFMGEIFFCKAFQVKETRRNTVYIPKTEIEAMKQWSKTTSIPVELAVKFKVKQGVAPTWQFCSPKTVVKKRE